MHLPKTPETAGLIGKEALAKTKPGVIIVNAARGGLIDEEALAEAVSSGHVRGAGLDVFATEPTTDSPLFDLPQVVVTPHLGASTAEAQDRAGTDVAESVKLALAGEFVPDAVNVGGGVVGEEVAPWLDLVRKLGLLIGVLSAELPVSISVQVRGELAAEEVEVLRLSALRGLFSSVIEDPVTFVNAPALAAERGVEASISHRDREPQPPQRRRRARRLLRRPGRQCGGHAVGSAAGREGRRDQRPQLRPARRGHQPDHQLRRPTGNARQDRHAARLGGVNIHAAQLSEDAEGESATILMRIDRDVPRTCVPASPTPSTPTCWKWWTCHEIGGHRRRRYRT